MLTDLIVEWLTVVACVGAAIASGLVSGIRSYGEMEC